MRREHRSHPTNPDYNLNFCFYLRGCIYTYNLSYTTWRASLETLSSHRVYLSRQFPSSGIDRLQTTATTPPLAHEKNIPSFYTPPKNKRQSCSTPEEKKNSQSGVPHAVLARLNRALDKAINEVLERRSRDLDVHVLRPRRVRRYERKRHVRLRHTVQLALRLSGCQTETSTG